MRVYMYRSGEQRYASQWAIDGWPMRLIGALRSLSSSLIPLQLLSNEEENRDETRYTAANNL